MAERSAISFRIADASDEPDVRRLLRENPMEGPLHISLEREPDVFASDFGLARAHHFVVARDNQSGQLVGVCERVVMAVHVNGTAQCVPYIGGLRVARSHRNRVAILRGGFAELRAIQERDDTPRYAFTSISQDNAVALRILSAGVRGLPAYAPLGSLATTVIASRRAKAADGEAASARDLASCATRWNSDHQFGAAWTETEVHELETKGLPPGNRMLFSRGSSVAGSIALWDQRSHRQAVIRHLPPVMAALRPFYNALSRITQRPPLPAPGLPMSVGVASHFSWADGDQQTFLRLVGAALAMAHHMGLAAVAFGFAAGSRSHQLLQLHFPRAMEFRTRFFSVVWPEDRHCLPTFDGRALHPELGLL
jgi:hypothetical protein